MRSRAAEQKAACPISRTWPPMQPGSGADSGVDSGVDPCWRLTGLTWRWVALQQPQQLHGEPGGRDEVIGVVLEVGGGRGDDLQEEGVMGGRRALGPEETCSHQACTVRARATEGETKA